jgi:hypothetical protein
VLRYFTWAIVIVVVSLIGYTVIIVVYSGVKVAMQPTPSPSPYQKKLIISDDWYGFPVVVGQKYRAMEGFISKSDSDGADVDAEDLLHFRDLGMKNQIMTSYNIPTYRHYGGTNEPSAPECTVADQDPIEIVKNPASGLGYNTPAKPIHCTLNDGTNFYALSLDRDKRF